METLTPTDTRLTRQDTSNMLVEYAADRLAQFVRPFRLRREIEEIISELKGEPVKVKQESFDELLNKAQQFIIDQAGERPAKVALKQIVFLQNIISDDDSDTKTKLMANVQLTDLVGTSAKSRSEFFDPRDTAGLIRRMVGEMEDLVEEEDAVYA